MNAALLPVEASPTAPHQGEVITFYSYKGGTGRSMLLANVAWHLASAGQRVLLMDWDLEAPGLHRYFRPFLGSDPELRDQAGVMQWLTDYWDSCLDEPDLPVERLVREYADPRNYVRNLDLQGYVTGAIDLMCAGRQDNCYASSVADFDFTSLYRRMHGEEFIETAKKILVSRAEGYDYVLVDSRTGVSDTSGFCTVALADTLVVCFTYNNQSVIGAGQIARDIKQQAESRRAEKVKQGTARRFRLFAVPSRVDDMAVERLERRQQHAWGLFEDLLTDVAKDQQAQYWDNVQIRNSGHFAYEEVLAACMNRPTDPQSVLGSVTQLVRMLTDDVAPPPSAMSDSDRAQLRTQFAALATDQGGCTRKNAWARFVAEQPDAAARDSLLQSCFALLVQLVAPAPSGSAALPNVRCKLLESELMVDERRMADTLTAANLVQRHITDDRQRAIELADDSLLSSWEAFDTLLQRQGPFIAARERIRDARRSWDVSGRSISSLRSLQGEFARIELDDQQRAWLGRPNLQFLMAVQELQSQESMHQTGLAAASAREEAIKTRLNELETEHQALKLSAQQREAENRSQANELRHETSRASAQAERLKVSAFAAAIVLGGIALGGYYAANKSNARMQDLTEQLSAATGKADTLAASLAAAEKASALDAASRHFQAGMAADDMSRRKRGDDREQSVRAAIDAYTRAIDADPRSADAYRARALSRARLQSRNVSFELDDWASYYDLRRSLAGRTQLIVRALSEPVVNAAFVEAQLKELLVDAPNDKESEITISQVADRLETALKSAPAATRASVQPTINRLQDLAGKPQARTNKPEVAKKAALAAAAPRAETTPVRTQEPSARAAVPGAAPGAVPSRAEGERQLIPQAAQVLSAPPSRALDPPASRVQPSNPTTGKAGDAAALPPLMMKGGLAQRGSADVVPRAPP